MGSHAGRPESRAPHLKDVLALCRALNETGARYVLVGGFAGVRELIRTKDTVRPKDHNDILFLRRKLED